jgi:Zn-dependent protease with chaperone function
MNCTNCQTALSAGTSFCATCGTPVQTVTTAAPVVTPSAPVTSTPAGSVNGLAIASLSVSVVSLAFTAGTFGFVGAILGHFALKQIKQRGQGGRGLAIAGISIGWATTAFWTIVVFGLLVLGSGSYH